MNINYKLSNIYTCNQGLCLNTTFVLIKELTQFVILWTPFLNMIQPISRIDYEGISTTLKGQKIVFRFITSPQTKELDELKTHLLFKEKQLNFLKQEVNSCVL